MVDFLVWAWPHVWPGFDAIWPNILASVVWAVPGWVAVRRRLHRIHSRVEHLHAKQDAQSAHMGVSMGDDVTEKGGA